jgi:hypothetical protein
MRFLLLCVLTLCAITLPAFADNSANGGLAIVDPVIRQSTLMGQTLSVEQDSATVSSGLGVVSTTQTQFVGHSMTLMEASVEAIPGASDDATQAALAVAAAQANLTQSISTATTSTTTATPATTPVPGEIVLGKTDLYIDGIKLWTGSLQYANGSLSYTGGVPPTQIPYTIFVYPVGPMTLQVDAGVEFEGSLDASITPGLSYPFTDSTLDAQLSANIAAGGFVEGYANLWLIRAGVGGAVDLVDGATGVVGHIYMNGQAPSGAGFGMIHLLSGDIYAFVDTRFFLGQWDRIWKKDFYNWAGWCYSFGATSCGIQ